jgi:dephospho-CoA kinase
MSQFVVGLTGGIGSGKSTVAALFADLGITVIDADIIAREVVAPGEQALVSIVKRFGQTIVDQQGQLDRRQLRDRIFSQPEQKIWLNNLLHPLIRQQMLQQTRQATSSYCILAIPLLVENNLQTLVDRVLVVDVSEATQLSRTVRRDNNSEQQVKNIMQAQASRQQRLALADDVIYNDGDPTELAPQVKKLHNHYLALVSQAKEPE